MRILTKNKMIQKILDFILNQLKIQLIISIRFQLINIVHIANFPKSNNQSLMTFFNKLNQTSFNNRHKILKNNNKTHFSKRIRFKMKIKNNKLV